MLLREAVGGESPPDVLEKVLRAVSTDATAPKRVRGARSLVTLPSARPSRTPIFAIAAILALAAICLGFMHFQRIADHRTPTLSAFTGSVNRAVGKLHSGDIIKTGPDSTATLRYQDGTQVTLDPSSSITISKLSLTNQSKALSVTIGGLHADVAPQGSEYPMTLVSAHAHAIVVGTKLSFSASPTRTRLEVSEGEVRFEPKNENKPIKVITGEFAEADQLRRSISGLITPPSKGSITGFTLFNADTDQAIHLDPVKSGQTISLSSLPTKRISLRAEFIGEKPFNVLFAAIRLDGKGTGLKRLVPQHYAPYFLAGDFSENQRPTDCRPWTPKPGTYRISAIPSFRTNNAQESGESHSIEITFTE